MIHLLICICMPPFYLHNLVYGTSPDLYTFTILLFARSCLTFFATPSILHNPVYDTPPGLYNLQKIPLSSLLDVHFSHYAMIFGSTTAPVKLNSSDASWDRKAAPV